ncbi:hypothetical protein NPIL_6471 [Nephila pilipes]|uniref:Uncharacterized protein n=1 Tax=Nephila pilipes TaxID=299642 RepID=A0A8X6Q419_NEPPI|nr:hypothetical protein NPIL_6471 [Nephila pilipes]
MTGIPVLIYELPASSRICQADPNLFRRSFEPYEQINLRKPTSEPPRWDEPLAKNPFDVFRRSKKIQIALVLRYVQRPPTSEHGALVLISQPDFATLQPVHLSPSESELIPPEPKPSTPEPVFTTLKPVIVPSQRLCVTLLNLCIRLHLHLVIPLLNLCVRPHHHLCLPVIHKASKYRT